MMKTNMHDNSLKAHAEDEPKLSKRARLILAHIRMRDRPLTDRQVMSLMGFAERGMVQPRITELIKAKLLEEVGSVKCDVTGKTVRLVQAVEPYDSYKDYPQMELF